MKQVPCQRSFGRGRTCSQAGRSWGFAQRYRCGRRGCYRWIRLAAEAASTTPEVSRAVCEHHVNVSVRCGGNCGPGHMWAWTCAVLRFGSLVVAW